jgi:hypothetical protein
VKLLVANRAEIAVRIMATAAVLGIDTVAVYPDDDAAYLDAGAIVGVATGSGCPEFGVGIITALARLDGRPVGVIANNPHHLGGAIDGDAADKASRFLGLCQAHRLAIISLCDTPGSWSVRRPRRPRPCAVSARCSSPGPG